MPKVSLTYENGVQKGPATDYSMLLQMKRRQVMVTEANSRAATNGRKGTGLVVDTQKTRGFDENAVKAVYVARGAVLGFFKW